MLQFVKKMIITGAEQRTKKDGTTYVLVHVLGSNGQTFACMYKGEVNKIMTLEKMKEYNIAFWFTVDMAWACIEWLYKKIPGVD